MSPALLMASTWKIPLLAWLRTISRDCQRAAELYGSVVTQARDPAFYAGCGINDTPEGRYELVILHLCLVLERLRAEGSAGKELSRRLIETFVTDMDDNMREMGVGDLTVPKKVKRAAAGLYDRAGAYRAGLAEPDGGLLARCLASSLPGLPDRDGAALSLASYMRDAVRRLANISMADLAGGQTLFPPAPLANAKCPIEGGSR